MGFEKMPQVEGEEKQDAWVLGAPFLRRFYSIFDADHHRIGLVKSRHALEGVVDISDLVPLSHAGKSVAAEGSRIDTTRLHFLLVIRK